MRQEQLRTKRAKRIEWSNVFTFSSVLDVAIMSEAILAGFIIVRFASLAHLGPSGYISMMLWRRRVSDSCCPKA